MTTEHEYKPLADWNPKDGQRFVDEDGDFIHIAQGMAWASWWDDENRMESFDWFDAMAKCRPINRTASDPEASMYENERARCFLSDDELKCVQVAYNEKRLLKLGCDAAFGLVGESDCAGPSDVLRIIPKPKPRKLTISEAQELLCDMLGEDVVIEGAE